MKTAISLPDQVFVAADDLAAELKVSRSELYVMALEKFIRERHAAATTQRLDAFIDQYGQPIDAVFLEAAIQDLRRVEW